MPSGKQGVASANYNHNIKVQRLHCRERLRWLNFLDARKTSASANLKGAKTNTDPASTKVQTGLCPCLSPRDKYGPLFITSGQIWDPRCRSTHWTELRVHPSSIEQLQMRVAVLVAIHGFTELTERIPAAARVIRSCPPPFHMDTRSSRTMFVIPPPLIVSITQRSTLLPSLPTSPYARPLSHQPCLTSQQPPSNPLHQLLFTSTKQWTCPLPRSTSLLCPKMMPWQLQLAALRRLR